MHLVYYGKLKLGDLVTQTWCKLYPDLLKLDIKIYQMGRFSVCRLGYQDSRNWSGLSTNIRR